MIHARKKKKKKVVYPLLVTAVPVVDVLTFAHFEAVYGNALSERAFLMPAALNNLDMTAVPAAHFVLVQGR